MNETFKISELFKKWHWLYTFEGILFILLGIAALVTPGIFSLSFELIVGFLLVIGGLVQGYRALKQGVHSTGFWLTLLTAILSVICGAYLLAKPLQGIIALTLIIAVLFFVDGATKIYLFFAAKDANYRGAFLLSGILSLLIGAIIYFGLPGSSFWAIGTLIGVNLIITGITQLTVLHQVKKSLPNGKF